jgi:pyruvate/2-oxoglutarate dehydrogenase complex dihydrolipoamide acyltransferase (E2) component
MAHLKLGATQALTTYRKVAIATWQHPRDPSTYSWLDLPIENAEAFLKAYPKEYGTDTPVSLTHYIVKILAHCLEKHNDINHVLRNNKLYLRDNTNAYITTLLKTPTGNDLSGFPIKDIPNCNLGEIATLSRIAVEKLKAGEDADTEQTEKIVQKLPTWLVRITQRVQDFFHFTLNVSLRAFGVPDDRFGSFIVTNFGPLGIENALVPLSPYCRCPMIVGVGKPRKVACVEETDEGDIIVARECVTITFTFDHRYADGAHGALMLRQFQKVFLNPNRYKEVFHEVK